MSGAANQSNKVAGSHTLTPAADQTVKQVPVEVKKAVVFFIGGAADKESYYLQGPNNNVADARRKLDADFEVQKQAGSYVSYHGLQRCARQFRHRRICAETDHHQGLACLRWGTAWAAGTALTCHRSRWRRATR